MKTGGATKGQEKYRPHSVCGIVGNHSDEINSTTWPVSYLKDHRDELSLPDTIAIDTSIALAVVAVIGIIGIGVKLHLDKVNSRIFI